MIQKFKSAFLVLATLLATGVPVLAPVITAALDLTVAVMGRNQDNQADRRPTPTAKA